MKPKPAVALAAILLLVAGCSARAGNIKTARDRRPTPAPPVAHPTYDPFAPSGSADAVWTPRVWDRNGTIVDTAPRNTVPGYRPPGPHPGFGETRMGGPPLRPLGTF